MCVEEEEGELDMGVSAARQKEGDKSSYADCGTAQNHGSTGIAIKLTIYIYSKTSVTLYSLMGLLVSCYRGYSDIEISREPRLAHNYLPSQSLTWLIISVGMV